jgi:3',5'-cyclic AMP phosphodiesterase CpdA
VLFGTPTAGFGGVVDADTRTYRDAHSGVEVRTHHARLTGLTPDTDYVYAAVHDGASPELGAFRTAPTGRGAFTFTSFGDQSTPTLSTAQKEPLVNDHCGSPAAGDVTTGIERIAPLFNLVNGDLCYANLAADRIRSWSDWFDNNSRSARHRPWMPAAGNHENELGNGPIGYGAYQAYFTVPEAESDAETRGLWYAFTAGSVRVISLNNDDICYQDGGNSYVRGYSGGAQRRFLEAELAGAQRDSVIDWVVVCMHQTAVSTAALANGADLGIREEWLPLFDRYGVDLVLCGHEHHYERSHPIRGAEPTDTRMPIPVDDGLDVIDATKGTVHLVIGGGGTSIPSNGVLFPEPRCRVLTGVGAVDPASGLKKPIYVTEAAPWSAFRDRINPYGFVADRHRRDVLRREGVLRRHRAGRSLPPGQTPARLTHRRSITPEVIEIRTRCVHCCIRGDRSENATQTTDPVPARRVRPARPAGTLDALLGSRGIRRAHADAARP